MHIGSRGELKVMKNQAIYDMRRKFNPKQSYMVLGNNYSLCIDSFIHKGFKVSNLITHANKILGMSTYNKFTKH
jgi:hypothetical protein